MAYLRSFAWLFASRGVSLLVRRKSKHFKGTKSMPTKKVLIAVTSHAQLGSTGRPTGYYLSEVSHPYFELLGRGFSVDFVSPQGGKPPMDPGSLTNVDPASARFAATPEIMLRLNASLSPASVQSEGYAAMLFAGGHGTMWDFADDAGLSRLAREIYERGGALAAVCHGPAALVNLKLSDGSYLVQGKRLAAFTEAEERAAELDGVVPFPLAALLVERGAVHEAAEPWQSKVVVDGRLVTGQNPASARGVGRALAETLLDLERGVVMCLRLTAREPAALKAHLLQVIPETRKAEGCRYSHSLQNTTNAAEFLLVQGWASLQQQQRYLAWRHQRGDLAELRALLSCDISVEVLEPFDAPQSAERT
jgi:putative intracellular protease/amidase/quinol monooxygenase YgiN